MVLNFLIINTPFLITGDIAVTQNEKKIILPHASYCITSLMYICIKDMLETMNKLVPDTINKFLYYCLKTEISKLSSLRFPSCNFEVHTPDVDTLILLLFFFF